MILFLDFDGVLHPDAVYLQKGGPVLKTDGALFMWAEHLEEALDQRSDVEIILSTSWVRIRSFERARKALPSKLRALVTGATWHSQVDWTEWSEFTRYQQIRFYLRRRANVEWLAIDDDDEEWGDGDRHRLVLTHPDKGLGDPEAQAKLQWLLRAHAPAN